MSVHVSTLAKRVLDQHFDFGWVSLEIAFNAILWAFFMVHLGNEWTSYLVKVTIGLIEFDNLEKMEPTMDTKDVHAMDKVNATHIIGITPRVDMDTRMDKVNAAPVIGMSPKANMNVSDAMNPIIIEIKVSLVITKTKALMQI